MSATASPGPDEQPQPRPWLLALLALLPVLGAYSNVLDVGFMWDDHVLIEQNADLHTLHAPWDYLGRSFWQHPFAADGGHAFYRPLVTFSWALDWALGGGSPAPFHLVNVALHLAVVTLVFAFARRRGGDALTAAVVAALFGVMPRVTESVTWIAGRTDVLATLLALGAWWWASGAGLGRRVLAGVALLLALLSKEVALAAGAALALERGLEARPRLRAEAPLFAALALAVATWWALRAGVSGQAPVRLHDVTTTLAALGTGVRGVLVPWHPNAQQGFVLAPEPWAVALGVLALAGAALVAARWSRSTARWRLAWIFGALAALALVCVVALDSYTLFSDRFLYLPLALGAVLAAARPWPRWLVASGAAAVMALTVVTWQRNSTWAEPLRFWSETFQDASPLNPGAAEGFADALSDVHRFEEARALYVRARDAQAPPGEPRTRLSIAVMDSRLGHDDAALRALEALLAERPDWKRARYDLALFRARAQDFTGARAAVETARARFGADPDLARFAAGLDEAERALASGTALEQARAQHALGATARAQALYQRLLAQPDARLEAARWLVLFGDEAVAREARALLGEDPAADVTWRERFGEARVP